MLAPEGIAPRKASSAAAERHPSSKSKGSKAGQSLPHSSRQAEKLAGACSAAPSGPKSASSDAQRSKTPIFFSQRATDKLTQSRSKIIVRSPQPAHLGIRGHGATRVHHPEQDLNSLKAPWASWNLPMADKRARALPTRRPRSSSHHASDPIGAVSPMRRKPSVKAERKHQTAAEDPAQKPSSRKKEQTSMPPGCEASVAARASAMAG